jgi:hypothetical protein
MVVDSPTTWKSPSRSRWPSSSPSGLPQRKAEDYLIQRVNRQPAAAGQVLHEGDRVTFTPHEDRGGPSQVVASGLCLSVSPSGPGGAGRWRRSAPPGPEGGSRQVGLPPNCAPVSHFAFNVTARSTQSCLPGRLFLGPPRMNQQHALRVALRLQEFLQNRAARQAESTLNNSPQPIPPLVGTASFQSP